MKHKHLPILGLVAIALSSCQTTSSNNNSLNQAANKAFAPVYNISLLYSGAVDVLYCSGSFMHKNGRWPNDYAELSAFVKQSNGYLTLGEYERVDLKALPDDGLEIRFVRLGQTNESKITFGGGVEKK